jgi:hypothetical protein
MKVFLRFSRAFSLQRFDRADFLPFGRAVFLIGFRAVDFRGEVWSRPKSWWKFRLGATVLEPEPSGMLCRVHVNVKH